MSSYSPVRTYLNASRTLLYSYLISLPLLLLYEALLYISQPDSAHAVRISVDVWVKSLFTYLGQDVLSLTLIILALTGIYILYRERRKLSSVKVRYFFFMLAEATLYAFVLAIVISTTVTEVLNLMSSPIDDLSLAQKLALSLGAGLYEELFFRVILVSLLLALLTKLFVRRRTAYILAILTAAAIFSGVHYIGAMGDYFTWHSFLFRFLFGIALNIIYIWRGFGMAAWTHAIYDVMVITF